MTKNDEWKSTMTRNEAVIFAYKGGKQDEVVRELSWHGIDVYRVDSSELAEHMDDGRTLGLSVTPKGLGYTFARFSTDKELVDYCKKSKLKLAKLSLAEKPINKAN